jgi:succinate dehydrogenase / fumarate reductase cytochrome b subunit
MDTSHDAVNKQAGASSAKATLWISLVLTVLLGAKLFGVY